MTFFLVSDARKVDFSMFSRISALISRQAGVSSLMVMSFASERRRAEASEMI